MVCNHVVGGVVGGTVVIDGVNVFNIVTIEVKLIVDCSVGHAVGSLT